MWWCHEQWRFNQLATRQVEPSRSRRLFLFTDAMPNVGATGDGEFMELLSSHAQKGRETTVFGVNIAFGQELVTKISSVRGSNYFYLSDAERTRKVFEEDFDFLVTPIADDLRMALAPAEGFRVEAVYGLPGVEPGASEAVMDVATVFLSRRRGAVLARLLPGGGHGPGSGPRADVEQALRVGEVCGHEGHVAVHRGGERGVHVESVTHEPGLHGRFGVGHPGGEHELVVLVDPEDGALGATLQGTARWEGPGISEWTSSRPRACHRDHTAGSSSGPRWTSGTPRRSRGPSG
ncbi:hypothetical protein ACN28E_12730 [Archangium lansingense]|uniref:hypothetical protein n=1 Tax=Archangium lansingense TaxID=2995310 RepID=UPI003B7AA1A5